MNSRTRPYPLKKQTRFLVVTFEVFHTLRNDPVGESWHVFLSSPSRKRPEEKALSQLFYFSRWMLPLKDELMQGLWRKK